MVEAAIPDLRYPFRGNYTITFPFAASPASTEMRKKFDQWGILRHHGVDFDLPQGTKVLAVDTGKIILSGGNGDFGISVVIQHAWGQSLYAHLKKASFAVGDKVKRAGQIGLSGQTGAAFGPHLHFGLKPNHPDPANGYLGFIDPSPYLVKQPKIPPRRSTTSNTGRA